MRWPWVRAKTVDRKLADLRAEHKAELQQRTRARVKTQAPPSFHANVSRAWRQAQIPQWDRQPPQDPRVALTSKLQTYEFAASHGVRLPERYGTWSRVEEIDWSSLPDRVVLKRDMGTSGYGVLPLTRCSEGFLLAGHQRPRDLDRVSQLLSGNGQAEGPYFAEEFLLGSTDDTEVPIDVKVYAFYGEVGHILLRRAIKHALPKWTRWRYVDAEGMDLGNIAYGRKVTPNVPVPEDLDDLVETAALLSKAVALPFVRVDLYSTTRGVVLGELTAIPDGAQARYPDWYDEQLGELWEDAEVRLAADIRQGRPPTNIYGPHGRQTFVRLGA